MANTFDEYETESQKLLQGLQFLDFEEEQKGIDNKKLFYENSKNQLTDYKWKYLKRNSTEIENLFFKNSTQQYRSNNLTLIQEPNCNCAINPKEFYVYYESGKTKGYQNDEDEFLFKIKIFVSTRGEEIKQAYFECNPYEDEALFFIEDNTGDSSKAKMYAKFGNKVSKNILLSITSNDKQKVTATFKNIPGINDDILKELINNGIYEEKSSVIKGVAIGFYKFMAYLGLPMKALGWLSEKLGEGIIEYLSIPENFWNSSSEEYVLKRENVLKRLIIDSTLIENIREALENDPQKVEMNDLIPDFIVRNTNLFLNAIQSLIQNYNDYVTQTINNFYDENEIALLVLDIQYQISEKIALFCGIWNGIVDFIGGLLVFIGQIAQIQYNVGSNLEDYLERFDSFCETVSNLKWEETTTAFSKVYEDIKKYFKDNSETDFNYDKIAYFTGFAVAFIATMFIPFTAFAKPLNAINKLKKIVVPTELVEKVSQATVKTTNFVVKAGKEASETALKSIDDIIKLLRKGGEAITEFFKDIWKKIADWFLENKKVFENLSKKAKDLLRKESKTEELFRDVFKKFVVKNNGILKERQFLKIAKQIEKHFGTKLLWIDRNNKEFSLLFKKWQDQPIFAVFHSTTFKNGRYGIVLEGPAIYFFNGVTKLGQRIEITAYTLQHELIHLKLWYKMTKEFPELMSLYKKIPRWLDEANVIGEIVTQNTKKLAKWNLDDIMNDLEVLNQMISRNPQWTESCKTFFGKNQLELKDFEKWDISKYLKDL